MRPHDIREAIRGSFAVPFSVVNAVLRQLVEREKLVYTYRDPCSYVELPCSDVRAEAQGLKIVLDRDGAPWICDVDVDVDPAENLADQGCWRCQEPDQEEEG